MTATGGLSLKSTPALRELLRKAAEDSSISEELRSKAAALAHDENVSWKNLRPLYVAIRGSKSPEDGPFLRDACKDSQLVLSSKPQRERNPELVARLQILQRREEERQYEAMVQDVTAAERKAEAARTGGLVTYKDQISYGAHVIVIMIVFYIMGYAATTRISSKPSMRISGGLLGLVFGMLLESVLLILHSAKTGQNLEKPRRKKVPCTSENAGVAGPSAIEKDTEGKKLK